MNKSIKDRIAALDWAAMATEIDTWGHARAGVVLDAGECAELAALYERDDLFRSTIEMRRYRFGEGQYRYFADPLPALVAELRQRLYGRLAPIANHMAANLPGGRSFPPDLDTYLRHCHGLGQNKPTPLLLRYEAGGYNRLHQDLYGAEAFPLQAVFLLSHPMQDFTGGEFMLVENQPRAQSIGQAIALDQGEMLIFPVRERPVQGKRGYFRAPMRHGVSRVRDGLRLTLGIIFHDAE